MLNATARPLALRLAPDSVAWKVVLLVAGSLLIAISAQLSVPLPFSPVPVTGQTFAVLLVGATLGSRLGFAAVAAYLAEGLLGAPVFAGGASAWSPSSIPGTPVIAGANAGYLVGFALAALVVGFLAERGWDRRLPLAILAMLAGEVAIYVVGLPWLWHFPFVGAQVFAFGLTPFLAGDLYKLALAALALPVAWRFVQR